MRTVERLTEQTGDELAVDNGEQKTRDKAALIDHSPQKSILVSTRISRLQAAERASEMNDNILAAAKSRGRVRAAAAVLWRHKRSDEARRLFNVVDSQLKTAKQKAKSCQSFDEQSGAR